MKSFLKKRLLKQKRLYNCLKFVNDCCQLVGIALTKMVSLPFLLLPIKRNKIVISSYFGKGYGDNGKYIVEELLRRNVELDIVWLLRKELVETTRLPYGVRIAPYGSLRALYELATAKVWLDNCRKDFCPLKRDTQYYIQTWHGGLGVKRIEGDALESLTRAYIATAKNDSKMADLFISNSTHLTNIYMRSFWYFGEILECGYPKNDAFFRDVEPVKRIVKSQFRLDEQTRIVLYAPTFRVDGSLDYYNIDYGKVLNALEELTKEKWVFLVRLHPNLLGLDNEIHYTDTIINASRYPDMQELVLACDILISDYSSCMFDAAMLKLPTFIYATDVDQYMTDRGTYFSMDELPFPFANCNEGLVENILAFDRVKYERDIDKFHISVGLKDRGDAATQIADRILEVCATED